MGEAARAPIGAWDIWAFGSAMWLNWFIPMDKNYVIFENVETLNTIINAFLCYESKFKSRL